MHLFVMPYQFKCSLHRLLPLWPDTNRTTRSETRLRWDIAPLSNLTPTFRFNSYAFHRGRRGAGRDHVSGVFAGVRPPGLLESETEPF